MDILESLHMTHMESRTQAKEVVRARREAGIGTDRVDKETILFVPLLQLLPLGKRGNLFLQEGVEDEN
jgi:hypothetical protein